MIPDSVLRGPSKHWTAIVQLDGQRFDLAGELSASGLGQAGKTQTQEQLNAGTERTCSSTTHPFRSKRSGAHPQALTRRQGQKLGHATDDAPRLALPQAVSHSRWQMDRAA